MYMYLIINVFSVPKPTARWGHSLTLVSSSSAVLIGGQGDKQLSRDSIWSLNPGESTGIPSGHSIQVSNKFFFRTWICIHCIGFQQIKFFRHKMPSGCLV